MTMKDFRQLKVWQSPHHLVLAIYRLMQGFPKEEVYGLTSQMRRASVSIAANIAEGCAQKTDAAFCRFLVIALGSGVELEYHLFLSHDLGLVDDSNHELTQNELTAVKKMLNGFIGKLSANG
jgi:four helix bundle protein